MKQQVFYIHGADSFTDYNKFLEYLLTIPIRDLPDAEPIIRWSKTLREDLGGNFEVFTPTMPNKQNAKYLEWKIWFERHFEYLHDGIILVGASQGGYFLAKYLVENSFPFDVKALFLLAAPFERRPEDESGEDGGDFEFDTSRVGELQKKAEKIVIMHSKDDPVVSFSHGEKYAAAIPQAEFITFENKNHFLIEKFPELLEKIRTV
ncbi:MAG: alpha/beta hydrolase [Patescibacteria group bacterium]